VNVVAPPAVAGDPGLEALLLKAAEASREAHAELLAALEAKFMDGPNATLRRKQARQAARAVLPSATETRLVVTGNYRAWRHFIGMRATEHADREMRELAVECLRQMQGVAASVFGDFQIATLADGSEIATSPFVNEG
jgi:thymidylate synthase (FAD)